MPDVTGPPAPQRGVPAPDRVDQLPTALRREQARVWFLGVHGGAGESTLAALDPHWAAADHAWPHVEDQWAPTRVVLVARSHARGLRAAQAAATQWAAGLVPFADVIGLIVAADAPGKLPKPLRDLERIVNGGVPRAWHLPWIEAWRHDDPLDLTDGPRELKELAAALRALTDATKHA